jgi:hypothetical protein
MLKRNTIIEAVTFLNIILFLYTGIAKIADYSLMREELAQNPILAPISNLVAILFPIIEIIVVLMLVVPRWRLKGYYLTLGLMILFTGYITILLTSGSDLPCSCGGIIQQLSWPQHLIFNIAFMIADSLVIWLLRKQKKEASEYMKRMIQYNMTY